MTINFVESESYQGQKNCHCFLINFAKSLKYALQNVPLGEPMAGLFLSPGFLTVSFGTARAIVQHMPAKHCIRWPAANFPHVAASPGLILGASAQAAKRSYTAAQPGLPRHNQGEGHPEYSLLVPFL